MSDATRLEVCVVACAEAFRGDGAVMCSPMGDVPGRGARLAKMTFEPDLYLPGEFGDPPVTYREVFHTLWAGRRHVMMGAAQLDRHGAQNISAIGDHAHPKVQLLGVRGAPGNTTHHATSYWVPKHGPRVFVEAVDFVCGVGGPHVRRIISDLGVFDLSGPGGTMAVVSVHPGVGLDQVQSATGFPLHAPTPPPATRLPTAAELRLLR